MRTAITLAALLLATPAFAASQACNFTKQCTVGDPCEETSYDLTLTTTADTARIEDISQTLDASRTDGTPTLYTSRQANGDSYILAVGPDNAASYWVRYPESEIEIVYTGTCGTAE